MPRLGNGTSDFIIPTGAAEVNRSFSPIPESSSRALRHSFISCRIAIVRSADQVALEAGNSAAIIFKHYREPTTGDVAGEWFPILPEEGWPLDGGA